MHPISSLILSLCAGSALALDAPFHTEGRWIVDNAGSNFTYIGANWPGHGEVMIPEGLQYQSIESLVGTAKTLGFNSIRLTFPIELVDVIEDQGGDVTVQNAFTNALGAENGTKVWEQVIAKNPSITSETTRLQVFDAVAAEADKQGIYVHLDNHVSKAKWCCGTSDGNAWFGDEFFDAVKWQRGLAFMAKHASAWPAFVSIGLRNEFRRPTSTSTEPYTWPVWYDRMTAAAKAVNEANSEALIFLSGLDYDTTLRPIPYADDLGDGRKFLLTDFAFADRLVLELHNYQNSATDCAAIEGGLWNNGFRALDSAAVNVMPVTLTEFGFSNAEGGASGSVYATCLRDYIPRLQAGWFVWVFQGGYYTREGIQDYEDTWGVLNHENSGLRNETAFNQAVGQMIANS